MKQKRTEGIVMTDRELIMNTVLNYVEGWYEADAKRMDQALHPKLSKRHITLEGDVWEAPKDWMIDATGKGNGKIDNPSIGRKQITILDMTKTMASVKLVSEVFDDYLHLAKVGDTWVIINALWDYRQ
jgi:hypothetical protein